MDETLGQPEINLKLKTYALGSSGDFTYIIVEKHPDFCSWFSRVTREAFGYSAYENEEEVKEGAEYKIVKKRAQKMTDFHEARRNIHSELRFDLFYGKDRVFIAIHAPHTAWEKLMAAIEKNSVKGPDPDKTVGVHIYN